MKLPIRKYIQMSLVFTFAVTSSFSYAYQKKINKVDEEKQCSFLKEKSANLYCIKEQQDELIIADANKKGMDYTLKNISLITDEIQTVVGMMFFVDKLEEKMLYPINKSISKEQYKQEFNNVKNANQLLVNKLKVMYPEYEKKLSNWKMYENGNNEDKLAVRSFANNREELKNVLKKKTERMSYWVKDLNYYLKNKDVNENLVLPLYLGQSVIAKKDECSMIKLNVPNIYETKIKMITGCK